METKGYTVAGGNEKGRRFHQLSNPFGLYVTNERVGKVIAGGNDSGSAADQLSFPNDVVLDEEDDSLIIADSGNRRVVRWARRNATSGTTIISDIDCIGVVVDGSGALYVVDRIRLEVKKYRKGYTMGTIVAGRNGKGEAFNQLSSPAYVFVDQNHSVQATIVAGGNGQGSDVNQLLRPIGIVVDRMGNVYVADRCNNRIMRWLKDELHGSVIIDNSAHGSLVHELSYPEAVSFDRQGNLYVVDKDHSSVQKFNIT
ncbi:unnamed protein product [Rotaria socialis]|uniref:NHL repeat-containing protein n=1 Tax=Rotaria socialis TaxID=392032 RepID=A0A817VBW0_9BILA|nr:unnamed protein product [Rotaria socialis]CAF4737329.1 unnamed protein product [Rotaria socialis]